MGLAVPVGSQTDQGDAQNEKTAPASGAVLPTLLISL